MGMDIEAVVLAAGYSSRAGAFKMGLDVAGTTVIERCVAGLSEWCSRIIVVSGYRREKIDDLLRCAPKVEIVFNPHFAQGMFTSVKAGVAQVRAARFFLTPGDYPFIRPEVCRQLLQGTGEIVIPVYQGRRGHPVLMQREIVPALLVEDEGSNLRQFIHKRGFQTAAVADEGILLDIDTPQDYQRILEKAPKEAFLNDSTDSCSGK